VVGLAVESVRKDIVVCKPDKKKIKFMQHSNDDTKITDFLFVKTEHLVISNARKRAENQQSKKTKKKDSNLPFQHHFPLSPHSIYTTDKTYSTSQPQSPETWYYSTKETLLPLLLFYKRNNSASLQLLILVTVPPAPPQCSQPVSYIPAAPCSTL